MSSPFHEAMSQMMGPELQSLGREQSKRDWAPYSIGRSAPITPEVLERIGKTMHMAKVTGDYEGVMNDLASDLHKAGYDRQSVTHMFDLASKGVGREPGPSPLTHNDTQYPIEFGSKPEMVNDLYPSAWQERNTTHRIPFESTMGKTQSQSPLSTNQGPEDGTGSPIGVRR